MSTFSAARGSASRSPSKWDRFWSKVDAAGDCWEWTAARFSNGYGIFAVPGRQLLAHRVSYEWVHGEIPDGRDIDHLCRNRACVNPDHLEAVSHRENVIRGASLFARHAKQDRCVNGHPFDEENTRILRELGRAHLRRQCRACDRVRARARRAAA